MKRTKCTRVIVFCLLLVVASIALLGFGPGDASAQTKQEYPKTLRFAALSPGSLLYTLISGLSKVASDKSPMTVIVIPTAGATTWLPMLSEQGTIDIGMENFGAMWNIWNGQPAPAPIPKGFPEKHPTPRPGTFESSTQVPSLRWDFLSEKTPA